MQRNRSGRRSAFLDHGDPFSGFGVGHLGGFGGTGSLLSNFFGGRDPFDDPFFTRPFGGMLESSFFGSNGTPFANMHPFGFLDHQAPEPKRSRGPIIEELNSDDEKEDADMEKKKKKVHHRKHAGSSNEPCVEVPDDEKAEDKKSKQLQYMDDYNTMNSVQSRPQSRCFTFHSSTVTYGGSNGEYYTSSRMKRTGSDGVTIEESKEADTATRQATHRVSRALYNKGHSMTRKLNSDGKVDTMQTLHNLNEDDIAGFEEAWNGNTREILPGWTGNFSGSSNQNGQTSRVIQALPSIERSEDRMRGLQMPNSRVGTGMDRKRDRR